MERFLAERVRVPAAPGRDTRRQQLLYTAAFWARADAIETLLADGAGVYLESIFLDVALSLSLSIVLPLFSLLC